MKTLNPIGKVIDLLKSLPGVGPRMAERLAYFIIKNPPEFSQNIAESIINMRNSIGYCDTCKNFTESKVCEICSDPSRSGENICVVEDVQDLLAIEKTRCFTGTYHVLHGSLSPLDGIGPEDLTILSLIERIKGGRTKEIIIATNLTVEGEATAAYIFQLIRSFNIMVTRIAQGVPRGSDLEYVDGGTLKRAFEGRKEM